MYEYQARVIRVVDGDTVEVDVDLGFRIHTQMMLRLYGINSPEMRGASRAAGQAAKQFLADVIAEQNDNLLVRTLEQLRVRTLQDRQEKYGRYLAYLVLPDNSTINDLMVASGHAVQATY